MSSALVWPASTELAETVTPSHVVPYVRAKVEVAWGQESGGLFTFGVSQFGGADLLAASSWSASFSGAYADLSSRVLDAEWSRGRDADLSEMRAGTATVHLSDPDGLLNRLNSASPLYSVLQDPADQPIRITLYDSLGVAYPRFYGFIETIEADLVGRGTATITAVDFLSKLDGGNPVITPAAGLTDGQIIGKILDWLEWTDPAMRALDAGDTIAASYTRANGTRGGLALISELLKAERGIVYVAGTGAVTYRSRGTRYSAVSVGTIDRTLRGFPVSTDGSAIVNGWTVQRTDMADSPIGVAQTAVDALSSDRHGPHDDSISTPFLNSDAQALALAQYLVSRTKSGIQPVYSIPLAIPDLATLQFVLGRELGDRVTMTVDPLGFALFTADVIVESIRESISSVASPRYSAVWTVSSPGPSPFTFGVSQFGGADPLGY